MIDSRLQSRSTFTGHAPSEGGAAPSVVDGDRRHLILGMAIDEAEEGRQQPALVLGRGRANSGGDGRGRRRV
jgi:hypothetical protein